MFFHAYNAKIFGNFETLLAEILRDSYFPGWPDHILTDFNALWTEFFWQKTDYFYQFINSD